jgi:hypothetical protein
MTRPLLFAGVAMVLVAPGLRARAEELKPEEIIDKAIRAHGGEEKLSSLAGYTMKERIEYPDTVTWDREIAMQLPGRYRAETKIGPEGKTRSLIVLDGDHGWMKMGDAVTPYPKTFIESFWKNTVRYSGPRSILRLRARQKNSSCQFATTGECTVEGRSAVGLRMKLEGGPEQTWYFDKESGLLLKEEERMKRFEGEDELFVSLYGDYQTFDGFLLARKVTSHRDGKLSSTIERLEFTAATPSESAFAKP